MKQITFCFLLIILNIAYDFLINSSKLSKNKFRLNTKNLNKQNMLSFYPSFQDSCI